MHAVSEVTASVMVHMVQQIVDCRIPRHCCGYNGFLCSMGLDQFELIRNSCFVEAMAWHLSSIACCLELLLIDFPMTNFSFEAQLLRLML